MSVKVQLQARSIEPFDDKEIHGFLQTLQQSHPDFVRKEQGKHCRISFITLFNLLIVGDSMPFFGSVDA